MSRAGRCKARSCSRSTSRAACPCAPATSSESAASPPQPPRDLEQEHVVGPRPEEAPGVAPQLEVGRVCLVLPALGPDDVQARAGPELPSPDRVDPQRLEVEVGVGETEAGGGPRA